MKARQPDGSQLAAITAWQCVPGHTCSAVRPLALGSPPALAQGRLCRQAGGHRDGVHLLRAGWSPACGVCRVAVCRQPAHVRPLRSGRLLFSILPGEQPQSHCNIGRSLRAEASISQPLQAHLWARTCDCSSAAGSHWPQPGSVHSCCSSLAASKWPWQCLSRASRGKLWLHTGHTPTAILAGLSRAVSLLIQAAWPPKSVQGQRDGWVLTGARQAAGVATLGCKPALASLDREGCWRCCAPSVSCRFAAAPNAPVRPAAEVPAGPGAASQPQIAGMRPAHQAACRASCARLSTRSQTSAWWPGQAGCRGQPS